MADGPKQGFLRIGLGIVRSEGTRGLYHGLSAGFMRSLTYGTTRIALYEELKKRSNSPSQTMPSLAAMAAVSGFMGGIVGTPSDIANIRMQNDRALPVAQRRNYRNVLDAWVRMKRTEGWKVFRQGLWPNCIRCAVMTSSQLASYDIFKGVVQRVIGSTSESSIVHLSASLLASLVTTTLCSPMDVIRTQLMSSSRKRSLFGVVRDLTRIEGSRWLFRGWTPSFVRLGPQTMATLVFLEQHRRVYRVLRGCDEQVS